MPDENSALSPTPGNQGGGIARKPYQPPRLIVHGTVEQLTALKGGNTAEHASNTKV